MVAMPRSYRSRGSERETRQSLLTPNERAGLTARAEFQERQRIEREMKAAQPGCAEPDPDPDPQEDPAA